MGEENSAKPEKKFKTIYLNSTQKQQKSICETEKKKKRKYVPEYKLTPKVQVNKNNTKNNITVTMKVPTKDIYKIDQNCNLVGLP